MAQFRVLPNAVEAAMQLRNEIIEECRKDLMLGKKRRDKIASKADFIEWKNETQKHLMSAFPEELFHRSPISVKPVSHFEFDDFRVENVLFCSLPGWEVNASVYLPAKPGRYPGVVCPTGHSSKFRPNYIQSCETLARNGYIVVSFCPPGCSGELKDHNDHFVNGAMGWLTGIWSQTHFLADALACIDYLETRADVDTTKGVAMTGVSGGGLTTFFCAALDSRITFFAPVCCLGEHEGIHLNDLYTSCPEQFGVNYIGNGMDFVDILMLSCPKPTLLIGGKKDEVFDYKRTEHLFSELKRIYTICGEADKAELFIQENAGHAYTVEMATEVATRLNRHFKDGKPGLKLSEKDILYLDYEQLACYPSNKVNMFTINADKSRSLAQTRKNLSKEELKVAVRNLLHLDKIPEIDSVDVVSDAKESWCHRIYPTILNFDKHKKIPGIFVRRLDHEKRGVILWLDGTDKWNAINGGGCFPNNEIGFIERTPLLNERCLFSVDISGIGELEMQHSYYDMASWNNIERIMTYLSIAEGKPIMHYRVRDALIVLDYLKSRADVDMSKVVIGGSGVGAITAILASLLANIPIEEVWIKDLPPSYSEMVEHEGLNWTESMLIPNILKYTDIPEIASTLNIKVI